MRASRLAAALAAAFTITLLTGAASATAAVERPIVYLVVIDGLDGDRVDQGKAPFISSLLAGKGANATYYKESRSVMVAETNPNHSAMITGAYGERSGIPGNSFALYGKLENENSCKRIGKVDTTKLPSTTSGANANCLEGQSVFEAVRRQGNPDGLTTAGIFGKPKLGRLFGGGHTGREHDADYLWAPCADDKGTDDDDYCQKVPLDEDNGYAKDDKAPMDAVIASMNGVGTKKKRPDFTFVNLQEVDATGHKKGTDTGAYDAAIAAADQQIERLVNTLRARGEWERTSLVLLSDHSMDTTPRYTNLTKRLVRGGAPKDSFLTVLNGSADMIYLANRKSRKRFALLKRMRRAALRTPGVVEALYREPNPEDGGRRHTLDGVHPGWHLAGPRTGDLVVTDKSGGAFAEPDNELVGNHGAPQTRDNFFAVIGGGSQVRQGMPPGKRGPLFDDTLINPRQSENVDPAPTVMGLLGLAAPRDSQGRFLSEAVSPGALPGGATPAITPKVTLTRRGRAPRNASCAQLRKRVPVTLNITPRGWHYTAVITESGGRRLLAVKDTNRSALRASVRASRPITARIRLRAASGRTGPPVTLRAKLTNRGCR